VNIKKMLILSSASLSLLAAVEAYAGGPDTNVAAPACPVCVTNFVPFAYAGLSAGWAYSDWNSFILSGAPFSADTNGFTYGGKVGVQVLDHFGIEGGALVLPDSDQTVNGFNGTVQSWFAYTAATIRTALPFNPLIHVTGKVGGAYRALDHEGNLYAGVGDGDYTTVMFGASVDYDFALNNLPLTAGIDYFYVPASNDSWLGSNPASINENAAPALQAVVANISVHFVI